MTLKLAALGMGKAGIRHLSAAQELDAVEVVGVADRAPELLKVLPDELAQNAERLKGDSSARRKSSLRSTTRTSL